MGNDNIIQTYIGQLRPENDKQTRRAAEDALIEIGEPVVEALVGVLQTGDVGQRSAAVRVLCKMRDKRALEPLIHVLHHDTDRGVRSWVARRLGEFRDERVIEPLLQVFEVPGVGNYAKAVLRDNEYLGPTAAQYLKEKLQREEESAPVLAMINRLQSRYLMDVYVEIAMVTNRPDAVKYVRELAFLWGSAPSEVCHRAETTLMRLLDEAVETETHVQAIRILGDIDRGQASSTIFERLLSVIGDETDVDVQVAAIGTLSVTYGFQVQSRNRENVQQVWERLLMLAQSPEDSQMQAAGIHGLGYFGQYDLEERKRARDILKHLIEKQPELTDVIEKTLSSLGFKAELEGAACIRCGRTQEQVKISVCQICGKAICQDHYWKAGPVRPPGVFCSQQCFMRSDIPKNPQYW